MPDNRFEVLQNALPCEVASIAYAPSMETFYLLTPCCKASGKGSIDSATGVVCRRCYREVDPIFGFGWDKANAEHDIANVLPDLGCSTPRDCVTAALTQLLAKTEA